MSTITQRLTRKTINDRRFLGNTLIEIDNTEETEKIPMKKIITESDYKTNGEILIVVKDIESCNITLDSNTTGFNNNAFGYQALTANITGTSNNAFGR